MNRCILHVGAHKTGSTAIQHGLFFRLRDPRFQYFSGGYFPNGSFLLEALFRDPPANEILYSAFGRPHGPFPAYRRRLEARLAKAERRAREAGRDMILSSEASWFFGRAELGRLRDHFVERGIAPLVVAYVRPSSSWLPSFFQESVKNGAAKFDLEFADRDFGAFSGGDFGEGSRLDVRSRIEALFEVFGRENVKILRFAPASFPEGCVVRHFCEQIGFRVPPDFRQRSNEGLSRAAVQFVYAFNRAAQGRPATPVDLWRRYSLVDHDLKSVPGAPLRFHPSLVQECLRAVPGQDEWLRRECGFTLDDPGSAVDPGAIRGEADLLDFSDESLAWLAGRTGGAAIRGDSPEAVSAEVARRVALLPGRAVPLGQLSRRLARRVRCAWVHRRYGC